MLPALKIFALITLFFTTVLADQVQYCRDGYEDGTADFCMAVLLYHNHTTSAHDLYLTIETRRSTSSSVSDGWTALGTGSTMEGALMFVMYGNPKNNDGKGPTLSVRSVDHGHNLPQVLEEGSGEGPKTGVQIQVVDSLWIPSDNYYTGKISVVCYGCDNWHGNAILANAVSQPWIYAFNRFQDLAPYGDNESLDGHGYDGTGQFYVDIISATTHHLNAPPEIDHSISQKGASDKEIDSHAPGLGEKMASRPIAYLHGLFMCVSFLILFPIGVIAIRSGVSNAFRYHWVIQGVAILCALCGAGMGLAMSEGSFSGPLHQKIGIAVSLLLIIQAVSGWWHHITFLQIRRRTWVSYAHMSVGWIVIVGGWTNVPIGLTLFGMGQRGRFLVGCFIVAEAVALVAWVYIARRRATQAKLSKEERHVVSEDPAEQYFALHEDSEDEEELTLRKSSHDRRSGDYGDELK